MSRIFIHTGQELRHKDSVQISCIFGQTPEHEANALFALDAPPAPPEQFVHLVDDATNFDGRIALICCGIVEEEIVLLAHGCVPEQREGRRVASREHADVGVCCEESKEGRYGGTTEWGRIEGVDEDVDGRGGRECGDLSED